jgi:hypothetical protein
LVLPLVASKNTVDLADAVAVVLRTYEVEKEFYAKHPMLLDTPNYGRFPIATVTEPCIHTLIRFSEYIDNEKLLNI